MWDENFLIIKDPRVHAWSRFLDIFREPFQSRESGFSTYHRPFVTLSFRIDHLFWKLNPLGYHLTNLLFHLSNTLLVYLLFRRLFQRPSLSFWGAFLFLAHPAHVEAVTYIPGRVDLISFFFFLCSFHFYLKGKALEQTVWSYALSLLFYLFALLSKEMAASLPLLVFSYTLFVDLKKTKHKDAERVLLLGFFLLLIAWLLFRQWIVIQVPLKTLLDLPHLLRRVLVLPVVLWAYLNIWFFPWPLYMDRMIPIIPLGFLPYLVAWIFLFLCVIGIFLSLHRPLERFWLLWIGWTLLPVIHIVPIYLKYPDSLFIAEHFLYFSSVGIIGLLLCRFGHFLVAQNGHEDLPPKGVLVWGVLLTCFSFLVIWRNGEFRDRIIFFEQTVRHAPWDSRAHNQLGLAYLERGNLEKAGKLFRRSVSLAPNPSPYGNLGILAQQQGKIEEAIQYHQKALDLLPGYSVALFNLGNLYAHQKEWDKAIQFYENAVESDPDLLQSYIEVSRLYWKLGKIKEALGAVHQGLQKDPSDPHLQRIKRWIEDGPSNP